MRACACTHTQTHTHTHTPCIHTPNSRVPALATQGDVLAEIPALASALRDCVYASPSDSYVCSALLAFRALSLRTCARAHTHTHTHTHSLSLFRLSPPPSPVRKTVPFVLLGTDNFPSLLITEQPRYPRLAICGEALTMESNQDHLVSPLNASCTHIHSTRYRAFRANSVWIECFDFGLNIPIVKIEKRAGTRTLL